jgi:UDP-2-acetamido-3-amino-2,3-dideoxy-glucuronate N-acetyltransferase
MKNVAVVGCGYWGKNLVRVFNKLGVLHTVCDVNGDILSGFGAEYSEVWKESSYSDVLANLSIKGIVIATPAVQHYKMAVQALVAGKDVFIEKPLTLSLEHGRELIKLAKHKDKVLMAGHLLEYHPAIVKLKELIGNGELGEIQYIHASRLNLGKLRSEEDVIWSFAPHDISAMLYLLNEKPCKVTVHTQNYVNKEIADIACISLEFQSGIKGHIFVSWLNPYKEQKLVVIGSKAMAEFNDTCQLNKLAIKPYSIERKGRLCIHGGEFQYIIISNDEPLKLECQEFIECIKTRRKPKTDGEDGLRVLEVLTDARFLCA